MEATGRPVRLSWYLRSAAALEPTWRAMSDTDRFNRAAGLGFRFEERRLSDGTLVRHGSVRRFGLEIRWEELPFQFEAPHWFVSERRFLGGPLARVEVTCRLEEAEDGTRVRYTVDLHPRSWLTRPVVLADARISTRPVLDRTLKQVMDAVSGVSFSTEPPPPDLSDDGRARLERGLAQVEPLPLAEELRRLVLQAPLPQQDRIQALALADRLGLEPGVVVRGVLQAVRDGALDLRWELLCPRCRAPKADAQALSTAPARVHCLSCNIRYDATFPDSVGVVFRPSPAVRSFQVPVDCLLSPQRTPHVLAQAAVRPGGEVEWDLQLAPGSYRIDTAHSRGGAAIEVRAGTRAHRIAVDLTERGIRPVALRMAPGRARIALRSRLPELAYPSLEWRWRPPFTLTAGLMLALPEARALLPPEAVAPGLEVHVGRGVVLAAVALQAGRGAGEPGAQLRAVLDRVEPRLVHATEDRLIAVYDDVAAGLEAASELDGAPSACCGLAVGPVVDLLEGPRRVPGGEAVEAALRAVRSVGAGRVVVHRDSLEDTEVVEVLAARGDARLESDPDTGHGVLAFDAARARRADRREALRQADPPRPTHVGGFQLGPELGRGGMGCVYEATDPKGRVVVVKLLLPELALDPEHSQRFYTEARLTARLDHANIVRVFDYGEAEDGRLYLAMERLVGRELSDELDERLPSPERLRALVLEVLEGLQAAHDAGVLHRDLKPANLFVLEDGAGALVKIIDFGIAHPLGTEDELAEAGMVVGTPEYMSPEQLERDPLDGRSDLYALGVVMYECLVGRLPFDGEAPTIIAMQRLLKPPRPFAEVSGRPIPDGWEAVVRRALELDPPRRWADARAMAEAVRALMG